MVHGSELWRRDGRRFITSDVQAVCEAALEFGIEEIVINDDHDSGRREANLLVDQLPTIAQVIKRPHLPAAVAKRVQKNTFGIIIVGQHAMYHGGGFAPHTIQSPPIEQITLNRKPTGEIGLQLAMFPQAKFLAIFGEEAAVQEARELCPGVTGGAVKSLEKNWFPTTEVTYDLIKEKTLVALQKRDEAQTLQLEPPYRFSMRVMDGYRFDFENKDFLTQVIRFFFFKIYKGQVKGQEASWETNQLMRAINIIHMLKLTAHKIPASQISN